MSVYIWGFGKLGQLGTGRSDTEHTPVQPRIKGVVVDVQCGGYYTAVVTEDGTIHAFGCGKYGRLGNGLDSDSLVPVQVRVVGKDGDVKIKKIACGIWHGAAISSDNNVYIWGYGKHGVLGSGEIPHMSPPTCLPGPFSTRVAGVACGNNFTLLWTSDGEAFSWGCGRHGVLGHGNDSDKVTPTQITKFKDEGANVTFMDAGFAHCGAVTSTGQVYMFGKSKDGALGLGQEKTKQDHVTLPTLVDVRSGEEIVELSCSVGEKHGHTLFVSKSGHVYSCGDGYKGKLGLGHQDSRFVPTLLPADSFHGEHITHVAAGGIHSTAVSREGHVFTWGCGSDGRLGHPDGKGHRYLFRSDVPRIVDGVQKLGRATQVCCSYYHTATLVSQEEPTPS